MLKRIQKTSFNQQSAKMPECQLILNLMSLTLVSSILYVVYQFQQKLRKKAQKIRFFGKGQLQSSFFNEIRVSCKRFQNKFSLYLIITRSNQVFHIYHCFFCYKALARRENMAVELSQYFQQHNSDGSLQFNVKVIFESLQLNHLIDKQQKKNREMQPNNHQFYPFHPFYEFQPYHSMFPYYHPLITSNSCCQRCQLNQTQPVQFIPSSINTTYGLSADLKLARAQKVGGKKNKFLISNSKFCKDKMQNMFGKNIKVQKSTTIEQKQGRNANSNLLRMFFRRLHNKIQSNCKDIQRVIKKHQMNLTSKEFIEWLQMHKVDYRNYIRVPSIKKLFIEHNQVKQHAKIMRILLKDFINRQSINCYLTSRKIRRQMMAYNFHSLRFIFKDIYAVKP